MLDKQKRFDAAVAIISPHFEEMEAEFEKERRRFAELFAPDYGVTGRILKCHLVLEHYLGRHLTEAMGLVNIDSARLSFYQKAALLPSEFSAVALVKPGILEVNRIRNRFAHNLDARIDEDALAQMSWLLSLTRPGAETAEPIVRIESFTALACTWLIPPRSEFKELFERAMATVDLSAVQLDEL